LANIIMLSSDSNKRIGGRPPSVYLKEVEKAAGENVDRWLASHLITMDAYRAARDDDFDSFLEHRAAAIQEKTKALADWD
jgi:hypothetical protein